jgi:hypothetical protein
VADLREEATTLLSSVSGVDLNTATTETILFTVPAGKTAIISHIVMRTFSADSVSSTVSFGRTGTATDFLGTQTLTGITASFATQALILQIVPNAAPVVQTAYAAGTVFVIKTVAAAGSACTCVVDVFGYLF